MYQSNFKLPFNWYDDMVFASKASEQRNWGKSRPLEHLNPSINNDSMKSLSNVLVKVLNVNNISIAFAWNDDETTIEKFPKEKCVKHQVCRFGPLEHLDSSVVRECQWLGSNRPSKPIWDAYYSPKIIMNFFFLTLHLLVLKMLIEVWLPN